MIIKIKMPPALLTPAITAIGRPASEGTIEGVGRVLVGLTTYVMNIVSSITP